MSKRKKYIQSCQVSEIKTYTLNGYPQKILLEGRYRNAPILIFLHGGPGSPIPFCAGSRGLYPEITDRFIMVYWDQLGCGINDYPVNDTFSVDSYVAMTVDLIQAVYRDFPDNPIHLFGISWGTILAARAAAQIPERICRVVVYGQIIKDLFFNQEVFDKLDSVDLSRKEKEEFQHLKTADSIQPEDVRAMAGLIHKHTEGYQTKNGGKTPIRRVVFGLLTSPDYTLKDFKAIVINGTRKNQSLWQEILQVDLRSILESITVPYFIIQGDTDIVTSTESIEAFVRNSENENLRFSIVPNSGHIPGRNGMAYIMEKGLAFFTEALS